MAPTAAAAREPEGPKPYDRNDANLAKWVEDFERVVKEAWTALGTLVGELDARITELENRIADTYTWGQKGTLTVEEAEEGEEAVVTLLALPLRVVRQEELLECTAATEVPGLGGVLIVQHHATGHDAPTPPATAPTRRPRRPPTTPRAPDRPRVDDEIPWTDVTTLTIAAGVKFVEVALPTPLQMKKDDTLRVVIAAVGEVPPDAPPEVEALSDVVVQARCR